MDGQTIIQHTNWFIEFSNLIRPLGFNTYAIIGVNLFMFATKLLTTKQTKNVFIKKTDHIVFWSLINLFVSIIASWLALLKTFNGFLQKTFDHTVLLLWTIPQTCLLSIIIYYIIKYLLKLAFPFIGKVIIGFFQKLTAGFKKEK